MEFTNHFQKSSLIIPASAQHAEEMYLQQMAIQQSLIKAGKPAGTITGKPGNLKGNYTDDSLFGLFGKEGVRNRFLSNMSFEMLRIIADKVIVIGSIINTRCSQGRPFGLPSETPDDVGFGVILKDKKKTPDKQELKEMEEIKEFFVNTGYVDLPKGDKTELKRTDTLQDVNEKIDRDLLTYDQVAIVPRYNLRGKLAEFRVIDGTTIKRVDPNTGFEGDYGISFVQEIDGRIVETFTDEEIIFDFMNKRSSIHFGLYGMSPIEQAIDFITSYLFATAYNKEFFNTSAQPKGFITFEGNEFDRESLEELRKEWIAMFSGVKGLWRTPFLQQNAKWQSVAPSNRDMEFNQYLQVLAGWICAIYRIDPVEMGQRLAQAQNVLNENNEAKIAYSKDRGLFDLLSFKEKLYWRLLNLTDWGQKYKLKFTGISPIDKKGESDLDEAHTKTYLTVNELRAEKDLPPDEYGDIILNPTYIQYRQAKEQQAAMAEQQGGGYNEGGQDDNVDLMNDFEGMLGKSQEFIEFELKL